MSRPVPKATTVVFNYSDIYIYIYIYYIYIFIYLYIWGSGDPVCTAYPLYNVTFELEKGVVKKVAF